jgi:3-isopropylmalate dehydrogenase
MFNLGYWPLKKERLEPAMTIRMRRNPADFQLSSLVIDRPHLRPGERLPLAVLAGEGIGPELIAACQPIFDAIESNTAYRFDMEYGSKIGREAVAAFGTALSEDVVEFCRRNFERGAPLFCGPGGDRFVYQLRSKFDIYCKFVPLQPLAALADTGALRESAVKDVDVLLIRENVGGVYQGAWHIEETDLGRRAHHSFHYDETHVRRIIELAVAAAAARRGKLCVVHKPGGTPAISELWTEVAGQNVADSGVDLRFLEVDTAAYLLLAEAESFDVMVTPNMFGDVLADAAALLLGSRGVSYSYNVSAQGHAVYQTGHGAAYDLAGTQQANPLGQIQTLAALLHESYGLFELAAAVLAACNTVLAAGWRTADIMTPQARLLSTQELGTAIAEQLEKDIGGELPALEASS